MIAKVRVAPTEQWCEANLQDLEDYPAGLRLVGMEVEIITEQMHPHGDGCKGRVWPLSPKSVMDVARISPESVLDSGIWFCEHMLEMD